MCDEAGCNFNAIESVYGKEFLGTTVTCQFHFKNCTKNQMKNINIHEQQTFKELCGKLCYTHTKHEYTNVSNALENLCQQNDIENWWLWWAVRWFQIVPAFLGFNISGLNLAKTGHLIIKTRCLMLLTVAAWRDSPHIQYSKGQWQGHKLETKGRTVEQS